MQIPCLHTAPDSIWHANGRGLGNTRLAILVLVHTLDYPLALNMSKLLLRSWQRFFQTLKLTFQFPGPSQVSRTELGLKESPRLSRTKG